MTPSEPPAWMQDKELDQEIDRLNERYAFVLDHGTPLVFREDPTPRGGVHITRLAPPTFRERYSPYRVFNPGTQKTTGLGASWLQHIKRRTYDDVTFDPNPESGGRPGVYNLFKGFPVRGLQGSWSRFREHWHTIGAAGDDDLFEFQFNWMAWLIQRPHERAGTAIVWQGSQGVGKGILASMFGRLVGPYYKPVRNMKNITGHFNLPLRHTLLLFADEAVWPGDKVGEGIVKGLISEPTLMIEPKGKEWFEAPNYNHLIIATNHEWAAPMEASDRRFSVVNVPDTYRGNRAHFDAVLREMLDEGGLEALMFALQSHHVAAAPVKPNSPEALEAARKQLVLSRDPFHSWWSDRLETGDVTTRAPGGWPASIAKSDLFDDYLAEMEKLKVSRRLSRAIFSQFLSKIVPGIRSHRGARPAMTWEWILPTLKDCRAAFALANHMPVEALFDTTDEEST